MTDKDIYGHVLTTMELIQEKEELAVAINKINGKRISALEKSTEHLFRIMKIILKDSENGELRDIVQEALNGSSILEEVNNQFKAIVARQESEHERTQASLIKLKEMVEKLP
jgi:hypothetical protein